jgi:hypothetical protein
MKYIAIIAFVAILGSLGTAFVFMMRKGGSDTLRAKRMATSLAVRVGLSILLFCTILLAWSMGWITPTGRP